MRADRARGEPSKQTSARPTEPSQPVRPISQMGRCAAATDADAAAAAAAMEGVDNTHLFDLLWILDFFLLHVLLREFCAPSSSLYSQLILVLVFSFLAY